MPRQPKGKRIISAAGAVMVASKNPNGHGSVYFEAAFRPSNGLLVKARWRATYEDREMLNGACVRHGARVRIRKSARWPM